MQEALAAEFVLERELGGGGMSRTFVARDVALGRRVVIKLLTDELAATVSLERFRREIALSAALQHPHIVPVLRTGELAGVPYFIMPFVDGESVRHRLESHGPLPMAQTVSVLRDVARALVYAHAQGVVHRDIKPDNILLASGSAVVADFGVAKAITSARVHDDSTQLSKGTITHQGFSLGTPAYMAPEQISGDPNTDHRADIYAFGVTAYEMLTGETPFSGAPSELLRAHLIAEPPSLRSKRSGITMALESLVMSCLQKDPGDRPQSATELVQRLDDPDVMSGAFATAQLASIRRPRRRGAGAALLGAGVLLVAAAFWLRGRTATSEAARIGTDSSSVVPSASSGAVSAPAQAAPSLGDVVVLPFVSLSDDSTDTRLAAVLTDGLSTALSRLPGVRVASRTAALEVLSNGGGPEEIGRALRVGRFVEGTVLRDGDQMRVTLRLVNTSDGFAVWNRVLDRPTPSKLTSLDALSSALAEELREFLAPAPQSDSVSATPSAALPAAATRR